MTLNLKVSTRLMLLLLFLVVISTSLVGSVTYYKVNQVLIKEELKQLENYTLLLQNKIQDELKDINDDLRFLTQTPPVQGVVRAHQAGGIDPYDDSTEAAWRERLAELFSQIASLNPDYYQIRFIGVENDGREITRVDQTNEIIRVIAETDLQHKAERSYFKNTIMLDEGAIYLSRIELNREQGEISFPYTPVLRVGTPVYTSDNSVFGIIIINIALTSFFENLVSTDNSDRSVYVTNQAGEFLIHPDTDKTFKFEMNDSYTIGDEFIGTKNYFDTDTDTVITDSGHDEKIVLGFRKVYIDPLDSQRFINIIVAEDYNKLIFEALELRNEIIGMLVLLILLAFLLAYFSSRPITNEINKLSVAVEHSPDSVIITDLKGTIEYVNRKFTQLTGYSRKEALGSNINILKSGETSEEVYDDLRKTINSGKEWRGNLLNRKKNGELYWEYLCMLPIVPKGKKIQHIVGLQEDITQQKQIEDNLHKAKKSAEEANLAKSQFIANMSHELRTPLNAIIGYSEMLAEEENEKGNTQALSDLGKIKSAGDHLLRLVNNVLDISNIDAGKTELAPDIISISSLVNEVTTTVSPLIKKNGNTFDVGCADDIGNMYIDPTKLKQILSNLLNNAAKFTSNGDISLKVTRKKEDSNEKIDFIVRDTGIGMSENQMIRVFESFIQSDSSSTRAYDGTGLGLAICKNFAELMGGTLTVKSIEGDGSEFTLQLPDILSTALIDTSSQTGNHVDRHERQAPHHDEVDIDDVLILLIDDDAQSRELLSVHLKNGGWKVITAADGPTGLRLAQQLKPTAILLDIIMPDMDGWEVLEALKNDSELYDIPVVICSILDNYSQGFTLGAVDYLIKPVAKDKLISTLEKYKEGHSGNLLVVEDNDATRQLLIRTARAGGWQVMEAENGKTCLQKMAEHKPDLILLDLMMPELDGFGVLEAMENKAEWHDIPVIVITAKELIQDEREWLNQRVTRIMEKGKYSRDELLKEISSRLTDSLQRTQRQQQTT